MIVKRTTTETTRWRWGERGALSNRARSRSRVKNVINCLFVFSFVSRPSSICSHFNPPFMHPTLGMHTAGAQDDCWCSEAAHPSWSET